MSSLHAQRPASDKFLGDVSHRSLELARPANSRIDWSLLSPKTLRGTERVLGQCEWILSGMVIAVAHKQLLSSSVQFVHVDASSDNRSLKICLYGTSTESC